MFLFETMAVIMFLPVTFTVIKRLCGSSFKLINWSFDNIDDWIHNLIRGKKDS